MQLAKRIAKEDGSPGTGGVKYVDRLMNVYENVLDVIQVEAVFHQ